MEELFAAIMTRVFVSAIVAGALTLVTCFLLNSIVMPFTRLSGIEKAETDGRVLTGTLIKTITPYVVDTSETGIHTTTDGIYQYEHNGKKYQYRGHYHRTPPTEEKLYFRKDPSKARPSAEYGKLESEWKSIFVVLIALSFVVTFFFF